MSLANKPVYPIYNDDGACSLIDYNKDEKVQSGITYKQLLVGMLASNPNMVTMFIGGDDRLYPDIKVTNQNILDQADTLIKELEKQRS